MKSRNDKPKCGLYGREPANYNGCSAYKKFSKVPAKPRNTNEGGVIQHVHDAVAAVSSRSS